MSGIDSALRTVLLSDSGVSAHVSDRIYFDMFPVGGTLPAITLSLISLIPDPVIPDAWKARVQCSCWSNPVSQNGIKSPAEITALADAVKTAINRTSIQKEVEAWVSGITTFSVQKVRIENTPRFLDPSTDWYHVPIDILIEFRKVINS
jgi:hypothetical protein